MKKLYKIYKTIYTFDLNSGESTSQHFEADELELYNKKPEITFKTAKKNQSIKPLIMNSEHESLYYLGGYVYQNPKLEFTSDNKLIITIVGNNYLKKKVNPEQDVLNLLSTFNSNLTKIIADFKNSIK